MEQVRVFRVAWFPALLALASCLADSPGRPLHAEPGGDQPTRTGTLSQPGMLVQPGTLVRVGSFRVPDGSSAGRSGRGFEYGGTALAFNPARDSLFLVGHDWDQWTAEISIPADGATAALLQPLSDASEGRSVGDGEKVGGQLVYQDRLIVAKFVFYDASSSQTLTHLVRPLSLATRGGVQGPYRVGRLQAGFYSGYMALIPAAWQVRLGGPVLAGNCCLSIISRTSHGPAVFAVDPVDFGRAERATPLVYYPGDHQTLGEYGAPGVHPVFNGSTRIRGVVFPEGTSSVLFFGTTGVGPYCYGEAEACGDPTNPYKGEHAYPYRAYVWAYDAAALAGVKAGVARPWAVKPYATWELPLGDVGSDVIGGAAYDPATGRIFISQRFGDGDRPLIHVYRVR